MGEIIWKEMSFYEEEQKTWFENLLSKDKGDVLDKEDRDKLMRICEGVINSKTINKGGPKRAEWRRFSLKFLNEKQQEKLRKLTTKAAVCKEVIEILKGITTAEPSDGRDEEVLSSGEEISGEKVSGL